MPQRFLRPGLTESDRWNACSFEAQSMYVRLLTLVDDFGRYDGRMAVLHAHCFALRPDIKPQQTAAFRSELSKHELIDVYSVDGKEYVQLLRWQERTRSEKSKYPDPQDSAAERRIPQEKDASLVHRSSSIVPSSNVQTTKRSTARPSCVEDVIDFCEKEGLTEDDAKYFFNTKEGNGWRNGRAAVLNWKATVRSWAAAGHLPSTKTKNGSQPSEFQQRDSKINELNRRKQAMLRQHGDKVYGMREFEQIEKQLMSL